MPLRGVALAAVLAAQAADVPTVKLNGGVEMPMLAFSTGIHVGNAQAAETQTRAALGAGYPAIDTAESYRNQAGVARALADFERSKYFLISKVGGVEAVFTPGNAYNDTLNASETDLTQLGVDSVDLMLLHFPPAAVKGSRCAVMQEQWRALEDFHKAGKARAIGVANYCQTDLDCLFETANVIPTVNQIVFHVGMGPDPRGLKKYSDRFGIVTVSYWPLGAYNFTPTPPTRDDSLIAGNFTGGIGKAYNKTGAQVALRWVAQHGLPFSTTSSIDSYLHDNLDIFGFELTGTDMGQLDAADTPAGEPTDTHGTCSPTYAATVVV